MLSRDFSDETLTGVRKTLLWKTKSDKSIFIIEDRISRLLYYHHENILQEG